MTTKNRCLPDLEDFDNKDINAQKLAYIHARIRHFLHADATGSPADSQPIIDEVLELIEGMVPWLGEIESNESEIED